MVAGSGGPRMCSRALLGGDRQPDGADGCGWQFLVAGEQIEVGCDPAIRRLGQKAARSDRVEVEDAADVDGKLHLLHRLEWRADEDLEPVVLLPHEDLDGDAARDLVGCGGPGGEE
ncbi:MAG: hypothetical protein J4F98_12795, partial [Acidobacteria bacterium]|nr:hypothetical protein [Acidobacteriota bacterium]